MVPKSPMRKGPAPLLSTLLVVDNRLDATGDYHPASHGPDQVGGQPGSWSAERGHTGKHGDMGCAESWSRVISEQLHSCSWEAGLGKGRPDRKGGRKFTGAQVRCGRCLPSSCTWTCRPGQPVFHGQPKGQSLLAFSRIYQKYNNSWWMLTMCQSFYLD